VPCPPYSFGIQMPVSVLLEGLEDVPAVLAGPVELRGPGTDVFLRNLAGAVHVIQVLFAQQFSH